MGNEEIWNWNARKCEIKKNYLSFSKQYIPYTVHLEMIVFGSFKEVISERIPRIGFRLPTFNPLFFTSIRANSSDKEESNFSD